MPYEEDAEVEGKSEDGQTIPSSSKEKGTKAWSDIDPSSTNKSSSKTEKRI